MFLFRKISLLFFLTSCFNVNASISSYKDSSDTLLRDTIGVRYFYEGRHEFDTASSFVLNTSLTKFQVYSAKNTLGNNGLAVKELVFRSSNHIGVNYKPSYLNFYKFEKNRVAYYNTKSPYTELFYAVGSKKEQLFKVVHSQNVTPNLNFSTDFQRIRSEGYYTRQQTNDNSFSLASNYHSKNNHYFLLSNIVYNSLKFYENGGLQSDSVFENSADRTFFPINLSSAQRREINKGFYIKQYYNLGNNVEPLKDSTVAGDSVLIKKFILGNSFSHSFSFEDNSLVYEDNEPLSGFYPVIYNDSLRTLDSTYYSIIENEVSWRTLNNNKDNLSRNIGLAVYLKHQLLKLNQMELDSLFNNFIFNAEVFSFSNTQNFKWNISCNYDMTGSNKGDYSFRLNASKLVNYAGKIGFIGVANKESPLYIYQRYSSNHFKWENSFNKTGLLSAEIYFSSEKMFFKTGVTLSQSTNYLYFNKYSLPEQSKSPVNIFSAHLFKDFHLKKWGISNKIIYQYTSNSSPVKIPELVSDHSLYYETGLFKNVLKMQIGLDVLYHSSYFAAGYMPATGQFFIQDDKMISSYPFVDFFMNFKIKRARLFFKTEHLNAGLMGYNYYSALHYPLPDRAFKFGVSWTFFD